MALLTSREFNPKIIRPYACPCGQDPLLRFSPKESTWPLGLVGSFCSCLYALSCALLEYTEC